MTHDEFEKGYKLLLRFFKEIGRLNDFKTITAKNNPSYKKNLEEKFNDFNQTWFDYFSYITYVGNDWRQYNDPGLETFREKWRKLIKEYNVK